MKGRILLAAVFLVIGLAAGWMTWLTAQAGEDAKWLFGVFAVFFLSVTLPARYCCNP